MERNSPIDNIYIKLMEDEIRRLIFSDQNSNKTKTLILKKTTKKANDKCVVDHSRLRKRTFPSFVLYILAKTFIDVSPFTILRILLSLLPATNETN